MPRPKNIITNAPFRSSNLAIPPSPFSPRLPNTPQAAAAVPREPLLLHGRKRSASQYIAPPLPQPLHWLWQCHQCHQTYRLSITRRCLNDGHYFCAGTSTTKRRGGKTRTKKHRACASEFDYQGWKTWGTWRRNVHPELDAEIAVSSSDDTIENAPSESEWVKGIWPKNKMAKKGCWNKCDYPSECRWGKQFGVQIPVVTVPSIPEKTQAVPDVSSLPPPPPPPTKFEDFVMTGVEVVPEATPLPAKEDFWTSLLASAKTRKGKSESHAPSPLASNPVSAEGATPISHDAILAPPPLRVSKFALLEVSSEKEQPVKKSRESGVDAAADLALHKGLEKVTGLFAGFVGSVRHRASHELLK
ncbi:hypothetical protein LTR66_004534 [Elasticomyces elasticus]|nr:hypothetical protein LTR66_004534 [Elasticomyces elasticus]KAK5011515.1 hypothetical protein LTR28_000877 [Elasticomyces elasticus]